MPTTKHSRRLQAVAGQLSARDARATAAAAAAAAKTPSSLAVAATRARRTLSEEQLLRFHSDGFLIVRKLLSTFEIMALSEHVDAIASGSVPSVPPEKVQPDPPHADVPPELGRTATTGVRKMYDLTLHSEEMLAHARHPAIVDVVEDLLGTPDLKLCASCPRDYLTAWYLLAGKLWYWPAAPHSDPGAVKSFEYNCMLVQTAISCFPNQFLTPAGIRTFFVA